MGLSIGPQNWWISTPDGIDGLAISCPVATTLPDDSRIICKSGGVAWIVAPEYTQVSSNWGNVTACGCIDNNPVGESDHGDITSINFPVLYNQLISCGFNPSDWFVPSISQLVNPGYVCRTNWDSFSLCHYWSSTECTNATAWCFNYAEGFGWVLSKGTVKCVRAFRCVTY